MATHRSRRRITSVLVTAFVALLVTLVPLQSADAQADPAKLPSKCSYHSARLLGWVWADGSYNSENDRFFFRTRSGRVGKHMASVLDELGLDYSDGTSDSGHDTFSIALPGYGSAFAKQNPLENRLVKCDVSAFLASMIEGEGSTDGKIFDDALLKRRNHAVAVANKLGIPTEFLRNQVRVRKVHWSALESLPFVACGRVPGGTDHCIRGQVPGGSPIASTSAPLPDARFYVNSGYEGASISLGPGVYNAKALGAFNNDIQSVRVPNGLQVTMCTHSGGSCKTFTEDVRRLPSTYINKASRILIEPLAG